jgi:hypothetical protein
MSNVSLSRPRTLTVHCLALLVLGLALGAPRWPRIRRS